MKNHMKEYYTNMLIQEIQKNKNELCSYDDSEFIDCNKSCDTIYNVPFTKELYMFNYRFPQYITIDSLKH